MQQASYKLQATAGKLKSLRVQRAIKLCERIKIRQETTVLRSLFLSRRSRPTIALKLLNALLPLRKAYALEHLKSVPFLFRALCVAAIRLTE